MNSSEITTTPQTNGDGSLAIAGLGGVERCRVAYSSLPLDGDQGRDNLALILTGERKIIWYEAPCVFAPTHCVRYESTGVDEETGEIVEKSRVVLIDSNGEMWVTSSRGAIRHLLSLVAVYGPFPWPGHRKLVWKKTKARSGNECLTCTIAISSPDQTTNSTAKKGKPEK